MRMAVQRTIGCGEDDGPIEQRENALADLAHVRVPQLEMAAELFAPLLVQVDQHVQPAIELQLRMDIEVGVDLQKSAGLDLMQSPAAEVRIGYQSVDARQLLEKQQH